MDAFAFTFVIPSTEILALIGGILQVILSSMPKLISSCPPWTHLACNTIQLLLTTYSSSGPS